MRRILSVRTWLAGSSLGTATLEFAVVGTVFLAMVFGSIEAARYMLTVEALRTATAEAARAASIRGGANVIAGRSPCTGMAGRLDGATVQTPFLRAELATATMSACTTSGATTTVLVTVSYPFSFVVNLAGGRNRVLQETANAVFY